MGLPGLTHGFVERGERGHAMHAGKVLCAQSSLVKGVQIKQKLQKHELCSAPM